MKKFINALEPSAKSHKYAKYTYYYEGTQYIFASACGHLFQAKMPEEIDVNNKQWKTEKLQLPDILPLKAISSSKAYFNCLKELVKRNDIDEIVVCTDPDREGQLIWALIAKNLKISAPVTRVWIHEWTKAGLSRAFKDRKDNTYYKNLETAGLCRMQADYFIGMNGTRVNTKAFGGYKNVINEGRVQSPTRFLVAKLEKEIQNFKPEDYWTITLTTTSDDSEHLSLQSGRLSHKEASSLEPQLHSLPYTMHKEVNLKEVRCPMLYKTNDVNMEAINALGLSAEKTTNILQKLYQDYGLTTYPRTDIQQISVSSSKEVMKIVDSLDGIGLVDEIIDDIKENHRTFQKHLINFSAGEMPHEAITPTYDGEPSKIISQLSSEEKAVYLMVVKRFLQGFYPPAKVEETKVSTDANGVKFSCTGKIIVEPNWMKVNGIPKDNILPHITDGKDYHYVNHKVEKKTTKPPARYTEASLLKAMENAGRFVEDKEAKSILKEVKGIGTEATRSDILKKLYKTGFLVKKGKVIYPTDKTMALVDILPNSPLTSPMMTAQLETKLSMVEKGKMSFKEFMESVNEQVDELVNSAKDNSGKTIDSVAPIKSQSSQKSSDSIGICPFCGREMKENSKSYYCPGYKDGCNFSIWKEIAGKKISKTTVRTLLNKGETSKLKGFTSRNGKKFDAVLHINKDTHKVEFKF